MTWKTYLDAVNGLSIPPNHPLRYTCFQNNLALIAQRNRNHTFPGSFSFFRTDYTPFSLSRVEHGLVCVAPLGFEVSQIGRRGDKDPTQIDQIQIGDKVLAYDLKSENWLPAPVLHTFQSDYRGFKTTIITRDDHIESTYAHPFWVIRGKDLETRPLPEEMLELPRMISLLGRWLEAGHFQIGDQLLLVNGKEVTVEDAGTVPFAEKVFNLEIAEINTYAIGKTGVLVQNSNCLGAEFGNSNLKQGHHTIPKEIQ